VVRVEVPPPRLQHVYQGIRTEEAGAQVWVIATTCTYELASRVDLRRHTADGCVEWGYCGSGAAQLALALLAHVVGDELAADLYQEFKLDVVAGLPEIGWKLKEEEIEAWVEERLRKGAQSL
jgi:hypothetical protein